MAGAGEEGAQPRRRRSVAPGPPRPGGSIRTTVAQSHSRLAADVLAQADEHAVGVGGQDHALGHDQARELGGLGLADDGADVLDVDAVDLGDLGHEQLDQPVLGQPHDELVDGPAAPRSRISMPTRRPAPPDPAGHLAQRAGPIGKPDAHDEEGHRRAPYRPAVTSL